MILWHFSCDHARARILADDLTLRPMTADKLVWLTDDPEAGRLALGFIGKLNKCDRTRWRFAVSTEVAERWTTWAHRNKVPLLIRERLDGQTGARPSTWWVAEVPLFIHEVTDMRAR